MLEKELKVWIGSPQGVSPVFNLSQYDDIWRFVFTVYNGEEVWQIPANAKVVFNGKKPDGTIFSYIGSIDGANAVVECGKQIVSAQGKVICELRFADNEDNIISTANFTLNVEAAPLNGYVVSKDDFSAINQLVNQALAAAASTGNAAAAMAAVKAAISTPNRATTIAEMAEDTTKVYIYVGTETGMNAGHLYYYGNSTWIDAGAPVVNTDDTLTQPNMPANAAAVGEKVSVLNQLFKTPLRSTFNLDVGGIYDNGGFTTSTTRCRTRAMNITQIPYFVFGINNSNYFISRAYFYTGIEGNTATRKVCDELTAGNLLLAIPASTDVYFRIAFGKVGGGDLSASDRAEIAQSIIYNKIIDNKLETSDAPADAAVVGAKFAEIESLLSAGELEAYKVLYSGGIKSDGTRNDMATRVTITDNFNRAIPVKAGMIISCDSGYKFNVALYSSFSNNDNFDFVELKGLSSDAYTVPQDGFVRIGLGTENDADLWESGGSGVYIPTQAGLAAANAIHFSGSTGDRFSITQVEDYGVYPIDVPPKTALEYHALWDNFVNAGLVERSLIANLYNDESLPIYQYLLYGDNKYCQHGQGWEHTFVDVAKNERPVAFIHGGMHGNERASCMCILDFATRLLTDPNYQHLRNAYVWIFVPLSNPWGFSNTTRNLSTGKFEYGGGYKADTLNDYEIVANTEYIHNGIRRERNGVDPNTQFDNEENPPDITVLLKQLVADLYEQYGRFTFTFDVHLTNATGTGAGGNGIDPMYMSSYTAVNRINDDNAKTALKIFTTAAGNAEHALETWLNLPHAQHMIPDYYNEPGGEERPKTNLRGWISDYTDFSVLYEGEVACRPYSGSTSWGTPIARAVMNTQFQYYLKGIAEYLALR